ncbi:MAG: S46 family peptidase [Bacteroidetes bacterium]|nr:S46 family peptidase [Bacteroidota bacterium]
MVMIIKRRILLLVLLLTTTFSSADEGMWLPQLLQQMNAAEMRLKGLQIPVEEIYSANKNSLKDAIVHFGGGCTGEIISAQGLLLTNHHCGFGQIQEHSTLEHNYLRDGFWAMTLKDELACPGLTATFIIRMEDVTASFAKELENLNENDRNIKIKEISSQLEKKAVAGTHYEARVRQFYSGNEFILIVSETFKDVRLVGAPPSSIGKFGGDTDNWMWPRHTGDFSMFRVYAGKNNKPADYSADNVPFVPRHFLSISTKGVHPEDFTMVYGFPGRTQQYISSYQVSTIVEVTNPNRIKVRTARLEVMGEAMRSSEALHLKYADKQSGVSNAWKKWKGESKGLLAAKGVERKQAFEIDFTSWYSKSDVLKKSTVLFYPPLNHFIKTQDLIYLPTTTTLKLPLVLKSSAMPLE